MTANSTGTPQAATDVANGSRLRMKKTREALRMSRETQLLDSTADAALAEVEEWETRRFDDEQKFLKRERAALQRAVAAEAERDRLTEMLHDVWRSYSLIEGDQAHLDHSMEAVEALLFGGRS